MNASNWQHAAYAVAFQAIIGFASGNWWAGAAFGAAFFIGREHAQREYHLTAGASVKGLRPWEAFDLKDWPRDALLDLLCPLVACVALAFAMA